jgi:hypothetical protein
LALYRKRDDVPVWLWRGARTAFIALLTFGAAMIILLYVGLADPPRAGPLVRRIGPLANAPVPANYTTELHSPIALSNRPYTLEIEATVTGATWGITFDDVTHFGIDVDGRGFFSVRPFQPDSTPFIHIRPESNKIALNVETSGQATLRINDEIAWRGKVPVAASVRVHATGRRTQSGQVKRLTITISHSNPS